MLHLESSLCFSVGDLSPPLRIPVQIRAGLSGGDWQDVLPRDDVTVPVILGFSYVSTYLGDVIDGPRWMVGAHSLPWILPI